MADSLGGANPFLILCRLHWRAEFNLSAQWAWCIASSLFQFDILRKVSLIYVLL